MTDLIAALADDRAAVASFLERAGRVPETAWRSPVRPGKWSPAQIAEHVALSYELSLKALQGTFPGTSAPRFLRPIIRRFFLAPVLKNGRFPRPAKAPRTFEPSATPQPFGETTARLRRGAEAFAAALGERAKSGRDEIDHPFFGTVAAADYLRLQTIHTNHHRGQFPAEGA